MKFKCISVGGNCYGFKNQANDDIPYVSFDDPSLLEDLNDPTRKKTILECLLLLAVCHNVLIHKGENGIEEYNASSPDELAFVHFAKKYGFEFHERTKKGELILKINGENDVFELLQALDFNSNRKRMSVIIRHNGIITLYCKGADSVIIDRLDKKHTQQMVLKHLKSFASKGYRTLLIANKSLSEREYCEWMKEYHSMISNITKSETEIESVRQKIENNLTLLGVTAIEDQLQENVTECINVFRKAEIKLWVLTGDKLETAKSIAHSSGIVVPGTTEFVLEEIENLENQLKLIYKKLITADHVVTHSIFITGDVLSKIFEDKHTKKSVFIFIGFF